MEYVWEKPVLIFYKERRKKPQRKAFAVIKARRITISKKEEAPKFTGTITDFFPLMGNFEYFTTEKGKADRYVVCWFEDEEDDFSKAWRRLGGMTFTKGITFKADKKGKKSYKGRFAAEYGKLE